MRLYFLIIFLFTTSAIYAKESNLQKTGDLLYLLIPSTAYGYTFYVDDVEGREQFYSSFALTSLITYGLKYTVNEKRPNKVDNHSFPSGHTSVTFQSATFLHKRYSFNYAIASYIGATLVGYSRVESKEHYIHDVLVGAIIGYINGCFFTSKSNLKLKFETTKHNNKLAIFYKW